MNVLSVANELKTQLQTITTLNVYVGPVRSVTPPAAVIVLPDNIQYDQTFGRGSDRMTWPILLLEGLSADENLVERIGQYANGSGATSIKAVIEAGTYTSFHTVRVSSADFDTLTWEGIDYQAVLFELDIFGAGS